MLRAPALFRILWNIARHFFDAHVQELLVFSTNSDYLEVVEKYIELKNLPSCVVPGVGRSKAMPGYFELVSMKGGPFVKNVVVDKGYGKRDESTSSTSCTTEDSFYEVSVEATGKRLLQGAWDANGSVYTWAAPPVLA